MPFQYTKCTYTTRGGCLCTVHTYITAFTQKYSRIPQGWWEREAGEIVSGFPGHGSLVVQGFMAPRASGSWKGNVSRLTEPLSTQRLNAMTHHTIKTLGQLCTFLPTMNDPTAIGDTHHCHLIQHLGIHGGSGCQATTAVSTSRMSNQCTLCGT